MIINTQQVGGIISGAALALWDVITEASTFTLANPELVIVKTAIIGATVGFVITTLLRLMWDHFVYKFSDKWKFLKPKK